MNRCRLFHAITGLEYLFTVRSLLQISDSSQNEIRKSNLHVNE